MNDAHKRVVVIGAGIVGLCVALYLQRDGWQVLVIDPREPGQGASKGNAGLIALDHVTPVALPGVLRRVPRMLIDPRSPLSIRFSYLPRLTPWLLQFLRASTPRNVERISGALASLLEGAVEAYGVLLDSASLADLFRRKGLLQIFQTDDSFAAARKEIALRRSHGVKAHEIGPDEIHQLAPNLRPVCRHGVMYPDCGHVVDPYRLTQVLADTLRSGNASFIPAEAHGFEAEGDDVVGVKTTEGSHRADAIVIAAGAWSRSLTRALGIHVPLETERGYSVTLANPGVDLRLPLTSGDFYFAMTPMENGLRLAGTVEFAGLNAPPNPYRHKTLVERAAKILPGLNTSQRTDWMGFRPSMPDSLPVIGRSPHHANIYLAFGHGHIGLTSAAVTGRAIADLASGRETTFDAHPFRPDRFSQPRWNRP